MKLSQQLFRDVQVENLSLEKNKRFVMERILMKGGLSDIVQLIKYYGKDTIKNELLQSRNIDKRTLSFCCTLFHLHKEDFRCYKLKQSITTPWNS